MRRSLAALALVAVALTGLGTTGCTRRQSRNINRVWRDSGGNIFDRVNINTASRTDLAALPGISDADAENIIRHRPYGSVKGLVRKGVLSRARFDDIQDYIYTR